MKNIDAGTPLALAGSLRRPMLWYLVLAGIPLIAFIVALFVARAHQPDVATTSLPAVYLFAPAVIVLVLVVVPLKLRRAGVLIDRGDLLIDTGLGRKRIGLAHLRGHGLEPVDLGQRTELRPVFKLWGIGLPGFTGGWFRLRNGEKAVCLLLDRHHVSYLRSDADQLSVLVSLRDPEELRARVQS